MKPSVLERNRRPISIGWVSVCEPIVGVTVSLQMVQGQLLPAGRLKVAVTVVAAFIVTLQAPVPEQPPPLQPAKEDPAAATAVKVTSVPVLYVAEQLEPQSIPAGLDVTVPLPVPALLTLSVTVPVPEPPVG